MIMSMFSRPQTRRRRFEWLTAAIAVALMATGGSLSAERRRALPELNLTTLQGAIVGRDSIKQSGPFLILYVTPDCQACDTVLTALAGAKPPLPSGRIVVVVADGQTGAKDLRGRYPALDLSQWLMDPSREGFRTLGLSGTPTVLGVRDDTIEWRLSGAAIKGARLRSVFESWLTTERPGAVREPN
jgi:hypothetical protein